VQSFKVPVHDANPEPPAYLGKRFEYYSKRVQTLVLGIDAHWLHTKERIVDPSVLSAWAAMPQLFPRLHHLRIQTGYLRQSTDPDALFIAWMRQPRIDELWMTVLPDDIALFERTQNVMARKWGDLETLHIEDGRDQWSIDAKRATPDMQRRWAALNGTLLAHATNLCDVRITVPISWAGVLAASTLPALTALELRMVVELPQEECRLPSGAFPHLDTLAIVDSTTDARLALGMLTVSTTVLKGCWLEFTQVIDLPHAHAVMSSVSQHGQLRQLTVEFDHEWIDEDWLSLFDTMLPMPHLEKLDTQVNFAFTETHFTQILQLCPRLEEWRDKKRSRSLSLSALMAILAPRPDLRQLPVSVDVIQGLPSAADMTSFGTHTFVGPLCVKNCDESSKWEEALQRLFPKVSSLDRITKHGPHSFLPTQVSSYLG
jgi:hypothetical protein